MAIHRPCPDCGAHVPLGWLQAMPSPDPLPQVTCPACGQFLAFPRTQRAAWFFAVLAATVAALAILPRSDESLAMDPLVYPYFFLAAGLVSLAFLPVWRLVVHPPGRRWSTRVTVAIALAWIALMIVAVLAFVRYSPF